MQSNYKKYKNFVPYAVSILIIAVILYINRESMAERMKEYMRRDATMEGTNRRKDTEISITIPYTDETKGTGDETTKMMCEVTTKAMNLMIFMGKNIDEYNSIVLTGNKNTRGWYKLTNGKLVLSSKKGQTEVNIAEGGLINFAHAFADLAPIVSR
jgi:hypothetical protein